MRNFLAGTVTAEVTNAMNSLNQAISGLNTNRLKEIGQPRVSLLPDGKMLLDGRILTSTANQ